MSKPEFYCHSDSEWNDMEHLILVTTKLSQIDRPTAGRRVGRKLNNLPLCGVLVWLIAGITACIGETTPASDPVGVSARLMISDSIVRAGQSARIWAQATTSTLDSNWYLVWSGGLGDVIFRGDPQDSLITFRLPDHHFQKSGRIQLHLVHAGTLMDDKQLEILPGNPVNVVESYAGNKTMVAASGQRAMVIAIPRDTFGNPAAEGTWVDFKLRYPGSSEMTRREPIDHMVSGIELDAGNRTGKIIVGASAGLARSVEETVELTPAWPTSFSLEVEDWFPYADSRHNVVLQTGFIRDAGGNLVADGTSVLFAVYEDDQLVAQYQSLTSSGSARGLIQNPDRQTNWRISALVEGDIRSNPVRLDFAPYVVSLPFRYDAIQRTIIAGPVTANLGQLVTDDLPVEIRLAQADSIYYFSGLTENGFCTVSLPTQLRAGQYRCQVAAGGMTTDRELMIRDTAND